jgi:membrane fusion protein
MTTLFRQAAITAQQSSWLGEVILLQPPSFKVWSGVATGLAIAVSAFLIFGTYTRRTSVAGELVPDLGLIKIYPRQAGTIVERHVHESEPVHRDQTLFVLSGERRSNTLGQAQASISERVRARQKSLRAEIVDLHRLEGDERSALRVKIQELQSDLTTLDRALEVQSSRLALAGDVARRYGAMREQGLVSQDLLDSKRGDQLEQQSRLDSLQRERLATQQQLADQLSQLQQLPLKYSEQRADKERAIDSAEQELQESEVRRLTIVAAPAEGVATAVTGSVGQEAAADKPLVSIVPAGSKLQAHFYVPSRAIGFIAPGQSVHLRYEAYPFEKFGHYKGTVAGVSRVALTSTELTGSNLFASSGGENTAQPLYRVTVTLDAQSVLAYGERRPLQAGMLVDADILQEKRRLYEWMLEPLYSLTGRL